MSNINQYLNDRTHDAILFFAKESLPEDDPHAKQDWIAETAGTLSCIPGEIARNEYITQLAKISKIPKATFKKQVDQALELQIKKATEGNDKIKEQSWLPKGVNPDDFVRDGFYGIVKGEDTGYYFKEGMSEIPKRVSNFVITPLFHKYDFDDNTRIAKVENGVGPHEIIEIPSAAFISLDQFRKFMIEKGVYYFDGNKTNLDKLNRKILPDFPKAFELKTLGWQSEGFFAYFNYVFNGSNLEQYNEAGIVRFKDYHYFSPASSKIYEDYRKEDDQFENDRYLEYQPSPISFNQWMDLFQVVYEDHAYAGIPFVLVSLFRDLVFKVDNNCPFLYAYGQSKSGKSKFAESVSNLFFKEMSAFNLNSGTDFAFAARLARFRNCPVFFNEFDDHDIKPEWFQAIKGAYDGEGRERGKGGSKKKTEIQRINSTIILAGQYLSTRDDNSVLSRSILRPFKIKKDRSDKQTKAYNDLKEHEKTGLSGILTELLPFRAMVEKDYYNAFNEVFKYVGSTIRTAGKQFDERVLRNYCSLATMVKLFSKHFVFPFTYKEYTDWAMEEIVRMSAMINENDILVDFWNSIETLLDLGEIKRNKHFKLEKRSMIKVGTHDKETVHLGEPKTLLFIRLKNVQQLYSKLKRQTGGQPMDITSLTSYLKDRDYYVGTVNSERFGTDKPTEGRTESFITSAFVFDYDKLNISLDREWIEVPETNSTETTPIETPEEEDLPF